MKRIDLTNKKFGKLTVIEMLYGYKVNENSTPRTFVKCRCDCGKIVIRNAHGIKSKSRHSCGCEKKEIIQSWRSTKPLNNKYNRLTILKVNWEKSPITVTCKCDCGNIVEIYKNDVINGYTKSCGCLQKEMASVNNTKDFTGYISETGVKILYRYKKNDKNQWLWACECPYCNKIFYDLPIRIMNNHKSSCGCKKISRGEEIINMILESKHVNFLREYSFDDLKSDKNYKLRFDFAIFGDDNKIKCLIEYDGIQHYKDVEFFNNSLKDNKNRDNIKNEYCKNKNIKLIRIPYFYDKERIEKILENI